MQEDAILEIVEHVAGARILIPGLRIAGRTAWLFLKGYDSSWRVIVVVSLTSAGPKYWMAPGKA